MVMDSSNKCHLSILSLLLLLLLFVTVSEQTEAAGQNKHEEHQHHKHNFRPTSLFVFGDSYADTGNSRKGINSSAWKAPFGITFPGKPAGRFSDGRVLTDYIAKYFGLKSPVPYRMRKMMIPNNIIKRGINFAFGGAGVFDTYVGVPNISTQIDYMEQLIKQKVYTTKDLINSVALLTVAGNDYFRYVATNGSFEGLPSFTASVVNQTSLNLMRIHGLGVKKIGVTALEPLGCLPVAAALFSSKNCHDSFNNVASLHNSLLNQHLIGLNWLTRQGQHNHSTTFVLVDLYKGFASVLSHPSTYNIHLTFKPCCVGVNSSYSCGSVDANNVKRYSVCDNPKSAFFWDSVHPTDAGWHAVYIKLRTMRAFQQLRTNH